MAVRLQNSNRRNDVHGIAGSFVRILDFAGLSSNLAYASVFIGYIGTDSVGPLIKRFAAKKPVKKMVEINNQRKAFLDMLYAWSEGLITGVRKPEIMVANGVIVGGGYSLITQITLANFCHAKPQTQISNCRPLPAAFRWWDAYRNNLA